MVASSCCGLNAGAFSGVFRTEGGQVLRAWNPCNATNELQQTATAASASLARAGTVNAARQER